MLAVLLVILVNVAIFLVVGAPVAFTIRRPGGGWGTLLIDALAAGLILVSLGVALYAWFGWAGPVLILLAWIAAFVVAVITRAGLPARWRPTGTDWWLGGSWVVVLLGAIALRLKSVNFLPWVGDMGAYVNWANEFVRLGYLKATWPPLFSSYLAISGRIFGPTLTTAAVPVGGLLLILVVARVTYALGAGRWATLITAVAVTLSVHAIWYSSFPASESLNAPLFVVWIGCLLGAILSDGRRRIAWLAGTGVTILALGLLRGDGPILLVPLVLLGIVAIAVPDWRRVARPVWLTIAASLVGALVSYWYGIQRIPNYYIATQVKGLMPGPLFRAAGHLGLFRPTIATAIVLIVASGVVCAIGLFLARRFADRVRETRAPRVLGYILGIALFLGLVANIVVNGEVWHIILRAGVWLTVLLVAFIVVIGRAKLPPAIVAFVLFLGLMAAVFLALQSYRLKIERVHAFHLYWDRYLVGEYIPLTFVLLGLALTVAWKRWIGAWVSRIRASESGGRRAVPGIVAAVLALAVVVPTVPELVLIEKDTYMKGAYEFETALESVVPSKATPVIWSATEPVQAPGFFFPNTWMAFAKPLARTFGYDVPNITNRKNDFAPDEVMTASLLAQQAVCSHNDTFVVFESQVGGPSLDSRITAPGITLTPLPSHTSDISLLSQPPVNGDWTHLTLTVKAWAVHVDATLTSGVTCPAVVP
jgi:hypothetical protein